MSSILAIGGAHIDRIGRLYAPHRPGASNPGSWETMPGGGVFNVARNLSRLGHAVTLVSLRGGDAAGEQVAMAAEDAGVIDAPITFLDRATASYTAILEPDGNLVTALADMAIYDLIAPRRLLTARFRDKVKACEMILCDANLPAPTLETLGLIARKTGKPLVAVAISPAKVIRFSEALPDLAMLFMNKAEARALTGEDEPTIEHLRLLGLRGGTITSGPNPVMLFTPESESSLVPLPLPQLADVTGAGDALASGVLDGWLKQLPPASWLTRGVALARMTASISGPLHQGLSAELLNTAVGEQTAG